MDKVAKNLAWLKQNWGSALEKRLEEEGESISVDQALAHLVRCDPSRDKTALDWLVKTYVGNQSQNENILGENTSPSFNEDSSEAYSGFKGFRWEDTEAGENSKVADTLLKFAQYRSNLVGYARSLSNYRTLSSVWSAVEQYIPSHEIDVSSSARALKRQEREEAMAETYLIHRDTNMIMAVPLSKKSAQWWGRGTRWCTAGTQYNLFDRYNQNSPLVVCIFPNGLENDPENKENSEKGVRKFQIWATDNSTQFMDERDAPVERALVEANWQQFKPLLEWALERNRQEENPVKHLESLKWFPQEYFTKQVVSSLLDQNIGNIDNIPPYSMGKEEWHNLWQKNHHVIKYMPEEWRTREICEWAIRSRTYNIYIVPRAILTEDFILPLIDCGLIQNWDQLPKESLTASIINSLIYQDSRALKLIPDSEQTKDDCWWAIRSKCLDDTIFQTIAQHLLDDKMVDYVIRKHPTFISFVPHPFLTQERCRQVLQNSRLTCLSSIPEEMRTRELCKFATRYSPRSVDSLLRDLIDEDFLKELYEINFYAVLSREVKFPQYLYKDAIFKDHDLINRIREDVINIDLVEFYIRTHPTQWNSLAPALFEKASDQTVSDMLDQIERCLPLPEGGFNDCEIDDHLMEVTCLQDAHQYPNLMRVIKNKPGWLGISAQISRIGEQKNQNKMAIGDALQQMLNAETAVGNSRTEINTEVKWDEKVLHTLKGAYSSHSDQEIDQNYNPVSGHI